MSNEKANAHWVEKLLSPAVAVLGLVVSLMGNVIQYQTLQTKQEELKQAQVKLDDTLQESRKRREAAENYLRDLEQRLSDIDSQIEGANLEERRGTAGLAFAPLEQKPLAMAIVRRAQDAREKLLLERAKIQDKIDAARVMMGAGR